MNGSGCLEVNKGLTEDNNAMNESDSGRVATLEEGKKTTDCTDESASEIDRNAWTMGSIIRRPFK